ncbi:hypothetical protein GCM10009626_24720 [Brachybacterium sacelli]
MPDYDWAGPPAPSEPEPLALPPSDGGPWSDAGPWSDGAPWSDGGGTTAPAAPDGAGFGAPRFEYPDEDDPEPPSRGLPAWSIVALVALQVLALVGTVGLVVGGVLRLTEEDPVPSAGPPSTSAGPSSSAPSDAADPQRGPGVVTDAAGTELSDGTGRYEDPARIGEHTFSWRAWTDGRLSVRGLEVDRDATLPGADGADVVEEGYRLLTVTYEVRYEGSGQLAPAEELWLTGESDRAYYQDISQGLVPDPMRDVPPLGSGESAEFRSVFVVPETDLEGFRLGVETYSGEPLYYAVH